MLAFNARFAIKPEEEGTGFLPFVCDLENILCVQEERVVGNDNCVRHEGRVLQIPEQTQRRLYVKAQVRAHDYPDGSLAILCGSDSLSALRRRALPKRMPPLPIQHRPVLAALKAKSYGRR